MCMRYACQVAPKFLPASSSTLGTLEVQQMLLQSSSKLLEPHASSRLPVPNVPIAAGAVSSVVTPF
jgi:hypothetical protein